MKEQLFGTNFEKNLLYKGLNKSGRSLTMNKRNENAPRSI